MSLPRWSASTVLVAHSAGYTAAPPISTGMADVTCAVKVAPGWRTTPGWMGMWRAVACAMPAADSGSVSRQQSVRTGIRICRMRAPERAGQRIATAEKPY